MTLGTFTPRARVAGDKLDLRQAWVYNRPYLVQAVDYTDSYVSTKTPEKGNQEAVWYDLMDVQTGQVLINCMTTSGALVDNLKGHVGSGTVLPLKLVKQRGQRFEYAAPVELDPAEMAAASQAYNNWGMVAQERARREAAAVAAASNQGGFGGQAQQGFGGQAPVQGGFQQQAPQGGGMFGGAPAQGGFGQPQQGQFGAPASGFEQPGGQAQWGNQQPNQVQGGFGQPQQGQFQQQAPVQGFGNQAPANDPSQGQFGGQAPQQGFGNQAPAQGGQFGGPAQGFQGQQGGQFVTDPNLIQNANQQVAQGQFGANPNAGQFQQPAPGPGQNSPAAQAALNQLNSGQFQ